MQNLKGTEQISESVMKLDMVVILHNLCCVEEYCIFTDGCS